MRVRIRHLCIALPCTLCKSRLSWIPACSTFCCYDLPSAVMAAIVRDDEAEVRECCECFIPPLQIQ